MASSRAASAASSSVVTEPQARKSSRLPCNLDHAPAGAAEARIDAEDANRARHAASVIARRGQRAKPAENLSTGATDVMRSRT